MKYYYLKADERNITSDYNEAGGFTIEQAKELVLTKANAVISPDVSGVWLILLIPDLSET